MQIEDLLVQKDLDVALEDKPEKMSDAEWALSSMDSLLRRFVISFLGRMFEEGVLGNYLVNRYMS